MSAPVDCGIEMVEAQMVDLCGRMGSESLTSVGLLSREALQCVYRDAFAGQERSFVRGLRFCLGGGLFD